MTDERPCNEGSDVVGTAATSETGRVFEDADSTSVPARAQLRAQTPVNNPYLRKPSAPAPVMVPAPVPRPAPVLNNFSVATKAQTGQPVSSGIGLSRKRGRPPVGANSNTSRATTMGKRPPTMDMDKDTDKRRQQHDNYDEDGQG
jgi:hypothetical protein